MKAGIAAAMVVWKLASEWASVRMEGKFVEFDMLEWGEVELAAVEVLG